MKKRSKAATVLDAITATIQTVLFAFVPIAFCNSVIYQVFSYAVLLALHLLYVFLVRKKVIDFFVSPKGIDTDQFLQENCAISVRGNLLTQIYEIQKATQPTAFEEYYIFIKWKQSATLIVQHFWDETLVNVVMEENVRYSDRKIYKKELLQIVRILTEAYNKNKGFAQSVELFACKTLANDIAQVYDELVKIQDKLQE